MVSPWLHPGLTMHWMSSRSGALAWSSAAMARTRGATVAGGTPRARAIALGVLPRARSARTRLVNSSLSMPGSSHLPVPAGHARAGRVALWVGFLAQPGARTVTGMLTGAGLAGRRHHDLAYRFFASARWSADQVGLVVAG